MYLLFIVSMDHFSQLFEIATTREKNGFARYLEAVAPDTRDFELFQLIKKHPRWTTADFARAMYSSESRQVNVRRIRKTLTDRLVSFLAAQGHDDHAAAAVRNVLNLADLLIKRHRPDIALHYLGEVKELASGRHGYALLEDVLYYRLRHAVELGLDAEVEFRKWEENHRRYTTYIQLIGAEAVLRNQLQSFRREGRVPDQDELMRAFYSRFAANADERRNPSFMFTLAAIFRKVMLSSKDYWRIEPSVQSIYDELVEHDCFTDETVNDQMGFLGILAQAAYRNRHFVAAEKHLDALQRLLPSPAPRNHFHYVRMISLRAAIFGFTGRYREAIAMLEKHLFGENPVTHSEERCQMIFNLALCKYCDRDFAGALRHLQQIGKSDQWLFERFGLEWIYKKQMVHLIILWDSGQYETAQRILEGMMERYEDFLKQDIYQRAGQFMHFVLRYFKEPEIITDIRFHREIRDAQLGWGEKEDIHAILFFSWLRARMLNRPFYPVLQARLREEGDQWDYPFSLKD